MGTSVSEARVAWELWAAWSAGAVTCFEGKGTHRQGGGRLALDRDELLARVAADAAVARVGDPHIAVGGRLFGARVRIRREQAAALGNLRGAGLRFLLTPRNERRGAVVKLDVDVHGAVEQDADRVLAGWNGANRRLRRVVRARCELRNLAAPSAGKTGRRRRTVWPSGSVTENGVPTPPSQPLPQSNWAWHPSATSANPKRVRCGAILCASAL